MAKLKIIGQKFGRLTVISEAEGRKGKSYWHCLCDCGQEMIAQGNTLTAGHTKSCGCLQRERASESNITHGQTLSKKPTKTYSSWCGMLSRCTNPTNPKYKDYGGRGITVCDRWKSFEKFLADMGDRPEGMTIDRIDNGGNYTKANCQWATDEQQANNKRNNPIVLFAGEKMTIPQLARKTGRSYKRLKERISQQGWSVDDAVNLPKLGGGKSRRAA
jgi:hypothetical protein